MTQYLFHQACRQFKILFTRLEFAHLHNGNHKHIRSWEVKALPQRDALCQPCQTAILLLAGGLPHLM